MGKAPFIEQLRACAVAAKNFAGGLVAELAKTTADALTEVEADKADRGHAVAVTIPASGWSSGGTGVYPCHYDLPAAGVTAKDRAAVTVSTAALATAAACGLCQTCETMEGKIRLWSAGAPETDMQAEYWIEQGKE